MGAPKGAMKVTRASTEKSRQISKDITLHDKRHSPKQTVMSHALYMSYMLIANGNCIVS
jgi:hypothetical protein